MSIGVCVHCFAYSVGHRVMRVLIFLRACSSTPAVMQPSIAGRYWERDVVAEPVCQARPIDVLWDPM